MQVTYGSTKSIPFHPDYPLKVRMMFLTMMQMIQLLEIQLQKSRKAFSCSFRILNFQTNHWKYLQFRGILRVQGPASVED